MPRPTHIRLILLVTVVTLILPTAVEAKRFKRYPGDVEKERMQKPAKLPRKPMVATKKAARPTARFRKIQAML